LPRIITIVLGLHFAHKL